MHGDPAVAGGQRRLELSAVHAGLNTHGAIDLIDIEDAVHTLEVNHHLAAQGQRTAEYA